MRPFVFGVTEETEEGVGTPAFDLRPENIRMLAWHQAASCRPRAGAGYQITRERS